MNERDIETALQFRSMYCRTGLRRPRQHFPGLDHSAERYHRGLITAKDVLMYGMIDCFVDGTSSEDDRSR